MQKKWLIKTSPAHLVDLIIANLKIDPVIAYLLIHRNVVSIDHAKDFLYPELSSLHDPFLFKDMHKAVARLHLARDKKEKVMIFGDYDVDGVTSSVVLHYALKSIGIEVFNHIPHRMEDGYGLNSKIAQYAREMGVTLMIAVDCGITAFDAVAALNKEGINVIILDHHEPDGDKRPAAHAIVNPKQSDCPYPFKYLASVGLAYKLSQAVTGIAPLEFLDLVAIGTVADLVPLQGENRILVKFGLPCIASTKNIGLDALLQVSKAKDKKMSPFTIGFILGPRINATGRMDSAHKSLDLFLSDSIEKALPLAQILDGFNLQRQKLQRDVVQEAMDLLDQEVNFKDQKVIVVSKEGWHKGVLGIVASKILDKYYRPTVVISVKDGVGTASARSIDGFHLHEALSNCAHILEAYGGHEGAAGLTIKAENIDLFRTLINDFAKQKLTVNDLFPTLEIDAHVDLDQISLGLIDEIEALAPYGEGNAEPIFCTKNLTVKGSPRVMGKETIKFWVTDGKATISAVGFGMAEYLPIVGPGAKIDLVYQLSVDDWNKEPTPQLRIKDIKSSV